MQRIGRNEPCPCGSGKKYKNCCLRKEFAPVAQTKAHDGAIGRAIAWLEQRHRKAFDAAVGDIMGWVCADRQAFAQLDESTLAGIQTNVLEWLLAEGDIAIQGERRRIVDCLLGQGDPLFTIDQRAWIQQLSERPLRLYDVTEVVPGARITLCDALDEHQAPIVVQERSGSETLQVGTKAAFRIMKVEDHYELSGAAYPFSMLTGPKIERLLRDNAGKEEPQGRLILFEWVQQYLSLPPMPRLVEAHTGDPIQLITDHYQVVDWQMLSAVLADAAEIDGDREQGWSWLVACEDGRTRPVASITAGKRPDRIEVFYRTQRRAEEGRARLNQLLSSAAVYLTREIVNHGAQRSQSARPGHSVPDIDPETMSQVIEQALHRAYANWADEPIPALGNKTPRQAIQTPSGLERVKGLIRSYEDGEEQQALVQGRREISFAFLWNSLGLEGSAL